MSTTTAVLPGHFVAIAPGSDKLWFLELDADRLGNLDRETGAIEWFDVPGDGPQGPHTLDADAKGNLWMALKEDFFDRALRH